MAVGVALSFAGARRPYAEQAASAPEGARARGPRCSYAAGEQIEPPGCSESQAVNGYHGRPGAL